MFRCGGNERKLAFYPQFEILKTECRRHCAPHISSKFVCASFFIFKFIAIVSIQFYVSIIFSSGTLPLILKLDCFYFPLQNCLFKTIRNRKNKQKEKDTPTKILSLVLLGTTLCKFFQVLVFPIYSYLWVIMISVHELALLKCSSYDPKIKGLLSDTKSRAFGFVEQIRRLVVLIRTLDGGKRCFDVWD